MNKKTHSDFNYSLTWRIKEAFNEGVVLGIYGPKIDEFQNQTNKTVETSGGNISVSGLNRNELLAFVKIFGGKWMKAVADYHPDKIKYSQLVENPYFEGEDILIVATDAEPPPSCIIEEVEELVPASTRKVRKMRCTPPEADDIPETSLAEESGLVVEGTEAEVPS